MSFDRYLVDVKAAIITVNHIDDIRYCWRLVTEHAGSTYNHTRIFTVNSLNHSISFLLFFMCSLNFLFVTFLFLGGCCFCFCF